MLHDANARARRFRRTTCWRRPRTAWSKGRRVSDELRRYMTEGVPYWGTLGLELVAVSRDEAVFEGAYRDDLSQRGTLHGGVLASIIDSVCACAAIAHTYPDAYVTT